MKQSGQQGNGIFVPGPSINICERVSDCFNFFYLYPTNEIKPCYSKEFCNSSLIAVLPKSRRRSLSSQLASRKCLQTIYSYLSLIHISEPHETPEHLVCRL